MKDVVLMSLFGMTLLLFASVASLYITDKKLSDMISRMMTSLGAVFLLFFSLSLLIKKAGGYEMRFASMLPAPFGLSFYANKIDAAFIAVISIIIILTALLPLFLKKNTMDCKLNFFKNLIYICLYLLIVSKNIFFFLFVLESLIILLFLVVNFDYSNIRTARRSIFYFFVMQIAFFIICSGLYIFQVSSGFSDISIYTVSAVKSSILHITFILIAAGFGLLTVFYNSIMRGYLGKSSLPSEFNFSSLTLIQPVLIYVFIDMSAPLLINASNTLLYILVVLGLILSLYGLLQGKRKDEKDFYLFSLMNNGIVIVSLAINALIYVLHFDSISYISLGWTMIIIISSVILIGTFNIINEYFQNDKTTNIIKIIAISINTLAVLAALLRPVLFADNKLTIDYFLAILAGILSLTIAVTNFVNWIKIIVKKNDEIGFEEIKID